jgi:hypothetical protein
MTIVLKTPEGKRVVTDTSKDIRLYKAPRNPPNTGSKYTSGTDLYAHKARSGVFYYYSYTWSMWQGSEDTYRLMTAEEVKELLIDLAALAGHDRLDDDEIKIAEEHFPGIFEEDA